MQTRGSTNKLPITKIEMKNKWHGDLFTNGKNLTGHHSQNFTIITISGYKQGISSTLPIYSWTLISISN